jgi:hypothetical protein
VSDAPDADPDATEERRPERPRTAALADALSVRRNAAVGGAVGLLVAVGAYLFRVLELVGPFRGTQRYPALGAEGWFLVLALVLASSTALLVATLLTLVSTYRRVREL